MYILEPDKMEFLEKRLVHQVFGNIPFIGVVSDEAALPPVGEGREN